jgi:AcrR family transcriptional regulator
VPVVDYDPTGQRAPRRSILQSATAAPAKKRILETANHLFYDEGIRSVGIDKIISESGVTKATFYKHYGSKDRLIVEYVVQKHAETKAAVEQMVAASDGPEETIRALVEAIAGAIESPGFRGCPFINAANEYPDVQHPARELVTQHRDWYTDFLSEVLAQLGHPLPGDAADDLMLARDGAMTGGHVGDPVAATMALQRAMERIIAESRH